MLFSLCAHKHPKRVALDEIVLGDDLFFIYLTKILVKFQGFFVLVQQTRHKLAVIGLQLEPQIVNFLDLVQAATTLIAHWTYPATSSSWTSAGRIMGKWTLPTYDGLLADLVSHYFHPGCTYGAADLVIIWKLGLFEV